MLSVRQLASFFCEYQDCEEEHPCRKHAQAMMLGVSKMVVEREVLAEMSSRGVVFVRLSPKGVLSPEGWSMPPLWFYERPALVEWARNDEVRRRWEARV